MLLYKHPSVQEACIIAGARRLPRRDREGGGRAACRSERQDYSRRHHRTGRDNMAAYKWPKIVQFVDSLRIRVGQGDVALAAKTRDAAEQR